jgi:heptosyltransferase III
VERDFYSVAEFLQLAATTPPPLVFDRERAQAWPEGGELTHFCLLQIGTWKDDCRWPREQWREVASYLLEHFDQIVVSTGPLAREVEDAVWLRQELGPRMVCTMGKTTWAQVAGLLYRARLYVGLDTAAMHLAAACECPIVAIFTTTEDRWFPWQGNYRVVLPEIYRDISDPILRKELRRKPKPQGIKSRDVIDACEQMLRLSPGSRREDLKC